MGLYTDTIDIKASTQDSRELIMPHQQQAVDALNEYFDLSDAMKRPQNGLLVMPTGSGKTFTAVHWLLCRGIAEGYRIVWFAHRQELIDQAYQEFKNMAPLLAPYGLEKLKIIPVSNMHLGMSQSLRYDVNVCSIRSVANKSGYRYIKRMLGTSGAKKVIVVIDEAHHAMTPSYQKVLKRITEINPSRILLGLTATPTRMQEGDRKKLFEMFNVLVNKKLKRGTSAGFIYEIKLKELIQYGFLARPIYHREETQLIGETEYSFNEKDVAYFDQFGDFTEKMKDQIAKSSARNKVIVEHYVANRKKYGKTLVFAINQLHAQTLCEEFQKAGLRCDYVVADKDGTHDTIQAFKDNKVDILINVQILTEGSDVPDIQTVFLTRETNSDSLLMQMIGRALRGKYSGGTEEAYIVDFHDQWNVFNFWLDPRSLDLFAQEDPILPKDSGGLEAEPDLDEASESKDVQCFSADWNYAYLRLYRMMKANVIANTAADLLPVGWFSIVTDEGLDDIVLVYNNQLDGYEKLRRQGLEFLTQAFSVEQIIDKVFPAEESRPLYTDVAPILEMLEENKEMPEYYSFEQKKMVDSHVIAEQLKNKFGEHEGVSDQEEYWLKEYYDKSTIVKALYKTFFMFKKAVELAKKEQYAAEIAVIDERKEYNLIPDYYNLDKLSEEVFEQYPTLRTNQLQSINWSKRVVKSWFGICRRQGDDLTTATYTIEINRLLSSPDIDAEAIKYIIFHELLHANGWWKHNEEFRDVEWSYPNSDEWDGTLDELCLKYKLDIPSLKKQFNGKKIKEELKHVEAIQELVFNPSAPGVKVGFKFCRNCGNKLPEIARFCDKCGENTEY